MPSFSLEGSPEGLRLAGHTYAFRDRPLEAALDELVRIGFSRVELWLGHVRGVERAVSALTERGLAAAALSAGGYYETAEDATRAFEVARAVGASVVVACVAPSLLASVAAHADDEVALCVENRWRSRLPRDPRSSELSSPWLTYRRVSIRGTLCLPGSARPFREKSRAAPRSCASQGRAEGISTRARAWPTRTAARLDGPTLYVPATARLTWFACTERSATSATTGWSPWSTRGRMRRRALRILRRNWESAARG